MPHHNSYAQEWQRKLIHLSSLWIPVLYSQLNRDEMLNLLLPLVLLTLIVDGLRRCSSKASEWFYRFFGGLFRVRELNGRLTGASYMMVAVLLCVFLFPKPAVIAAVSVLVISDTAAALIGRKWGRHPLPFWLSKEKSREGFIAFFLTALLIILCVNGGESLGFIPVAVAVLAAFSGAVAEAVAGRHPCLDDNLLVPLVVGAMLSFPVWIGG